jgi:hypothetical protein
MARIFGKLRHLWRDVRGVVTIEFAILLPMLVMLFLGAAEVGRYLLLDMKVQTTSAKLADLMTRDRNPTQASLQDAFNAVPTMLRPFAAGGRSRAIVSSVVWNDADDPPEVAWQLSGGGTLSVASDVGSAGGEADVPDGVLTVGGSAVIVAEMVYSYEPWLLGLIGGGELRHRAYFRPRLSGMRTLN